MAGCGSAAGPWRSGPAPPLRVIGALVRWRVQLGGSGRVGEASTTPRLCTQGGMRSGEAEQALPQN